MTKFSWNKNFHLIKSDKSVQDYRAVRSMPRMNIDADREWEERSYRFDLRNEMMQEDGR